MEEGSCWGQVLECWGGRIVYMCGGVGRGQGCGLLVLTTRRKGEQVNLVVEL